MGVICAYVSIGVFFSFKHLQDMSYDVDVFLTSNIVGSPGPADRLTKVSFRDLSDPGIYG